MALSVFDDRRRQPSDSAIRTALQESSELWFDLIAHASTEYAPTTLEWAFAGTQYGWSLRLLYKKRRLLYLIPRRGGFLVGVVLGEKAFRAANSGPLPRAVLEELNRAPKYAEGRGIRLAVNSAQDLMTIKALLSIKVAN